MPEFIGRPNLPNALAQSLVQLAAHQNDPIAEGIQRLGSSVGDYMAKSAMTSQEQDHQIKLKQMEIDARHKDRGHELLLKLIETGQATPAETKGMTAEDAKRLIDPNFSGPLKSMAQPGFAPPPAGSYASDNYAGEKLPAGYNIKPKPLEKDAPQSYPLTKEMITKAPSLGALPLGTKIPHKDYLDAVELEKGKGTAAAKDDMALAKDIVEKSNGGAQLNADEALKATLAVESKIKAHRRGEKVTFDEPAVEPEKKSFWDSVKEYFGSAVGSAKSIGETLTPKDKKAAGSLPGLKIIKKKA